MQDVVNSTERKIAQKDKFLILGINQLDFKEHSLQKGRQITWGQQS